MKPWIVIAGAVALFGVTQGGETMENTQHGAAQRAERGEARRQRTELRDAARAEQRKAELSLERVKAGCIPVGRPVEQANPSRGIIQGTILIEGMTSTDWDGTPLADGTLVCTRVNTGVIAGGVITEVASVAPADRAEYSMLFSQLEGGY